MKQITLNSFRVLRERVFAFPALLSLAALLSACAPGKEAAQGPTLKSLGSVWSKPGMVMTIDPISVAGGTITISYGTGGTCSYNYGNTWSDPELHDPNAGSLSIADGTPIVPWPNLNCAVMEGQWTYAVLVSNSLQLCQTNGCFEFQ